MKSYIPFQSIDNRLGSVGEKINHITSCNNIDYDVTSFTGREKFTLTRRALASWLSSHSLVGAFPLS